MPEATVVVHRRTPTARRPRLDLAVTDLTLDLDDQLRPIDQLDDEVRQVVASNAILAVRNDEPKVIILDPARDPFVIVKRERGCLFPRLGVVYAGVQVALPYRRGRAS